MGSIGEKPDASRLWGLDLEKGNTRRKGWRVLARSQLRMFFLEISRNGYFEHFELGFCMIKD